MQQKGAGGSGWVGGGRGGRGGNDGRDNTDCDIKTSVESHPQRKHNNGSEQCWTEQGVIKQEWWLDDRR